MGDWILSEFIPWPLTSQDLCLRQTRVLLVFRELEDKGVMTPDGLIFTYITDCIK